MNNRIRPTMASHRLDLPSICDICNKASYMGNLTAKKAQGGRRYAR